MTKAPAGVGEGSFSRFDVYFIIGSRFPAGMDVPPLATAIRSLDMQKYLKASDGFVDFVGRSATGSFSEYLFLYTTLSFTMVLAFCRESRSSFAA